MAKTDFVGTAAFGCPSPEGRLFFARTATVKAVPFLLNNRSCQHSIPGQGKQTVALAAGQPKAAISTKFFNSFPM
jgi:hypothetical protein